MTEDVVLSGDGGAALFSRAGEASAKTGLNGSGAFCISEREIERVFLE